MNEDDLDREALEQKALLALNEARKTFGQPPLREMPEPPFCSFCGESKSETGALVKGHGAHICLACAREARRSAHEDMFNLFFANRSSGVQIAKSGTLLLTYMKRAVHRRRSVVEAQGDEHHEIDLRLISEINRVLEPLIGRSEGDDAVWFQSMDWYGDGIRHLEFHVGRFPASAVLKLQALLVDEFSPFGILCWAPIESDVRPEDAQGLAIFSDTVIITAKLAESIGMQDEPSKFDVIKKRGADRR